MRAPAAPRPRSVNFSALVQQVAQDLGEQRLVGDQHGPARGSTVDDQLDVGLGRQRCRSVPRSWSTRRR